MDKYKRNEHKTEIYFDVLDGLIEYNMLTSTYLIFKRNVLSKNAGLKHQKYSYPVSVFKDELISIQKYVLSTRVPGTLLGRNGSNIFSDNSSDLMPCDFQKQSK